MSKRRYRQQVRAEAAEETRQRVLDALYELLRDQPAEPVSVEEIAQHARVSRSTVYLAFGSRSGLYVAVPTRASNSLDSLRTWMEKNSRAITVTLCFVFGAFFLVRGLSGLQGS